MNKKSQSTGFAWIIGLIFLFVAALLFVVFNQVNVVHLNPVVANLVNESTLTTAEEKAESVTEQAKLLDFFNAVPYVIFFGVILFLVVAAIRKGKTDEIVE